jgi:hypothetical protein
MNTIRKDFSSICFHFVKVKGSEEQIPIFYKNQLKHNYHEEDVFAIDLRTGKWTFKYITNDKVTIIESFNTDVQIEFLINEYLYKLDQSNWKLIITGNDYKTKTMQNMRKLFKFS